MDEKFFPFRLYSNDYGNSPNGFSSPFKENKPEYIDIVEHKGTKFEWSHREKFLWYCYDVIVLSQTEIEFVCFDIYDNFDGGKGKEIHRFRVTVEKGVTLDVIKRRLFTRGVNKRDRELAEAERIICQGYADDEAYELGISFKD